MANSIEKLTDIADELDSKGLKRTAAVIDRITRNVLKITEAQYVGVQGYWIRNERCWSNCYRQKRASKPELGAQAVWSECQSEYVESLNKDRSDWDKYAEDASDSLKKFASRKPEFSKKVIAMEKDYFHKKSAELINGGLTPDRAIKLAIQQGVLRYENSIIKEADKLLTIAEKLNENGRIELGQKVATAAQEIVSNLKVAGMFDAFSRDPKTKAIYFMKQVDERLHETAKIIRKEQKKNNKQGQFDALRKLQNDLSKKSKDIQEIAENFPSQSKTFIDNINKFIQTNVNVKGSGINQVYNSFSQSVRPAMMAIQNFQAAPAAQQAAPTAQQAAPSTNGSFGAPPANAAPSAQKAAPVSAPAAQATPSSTGNVGNQAKEIFQKNNLGNPDSLVEFLKKYDIDVNLIKDVLKRKGQDTQNLNDVTQKTNRMFDIHGNPEIAEEGALTEEESAQNIAAKTITYNFKKADVASDLSPDLEKAIIQMIYNAGSRKGNNALIGILEEKANGTGRFATGPQDVTQQVQGQNTVSTPSVGSDIDCKKMHEDLARLWDLVRRKAVKAPSDMPDISKSIIDVNKFLDSVCKLNMTNG